jgi:hypothetical protein
MPGSPFGGAPTAGDVPVATIAGLPWLVVDGNVIREGAGGRAYRATGYNCYVGRSDGGADGQTLSAASRDQFFASLRANSLVRVWCFQPAAGLTNAQALTQTDAIVASARTYGHRLILGVSDWYGSANDRDGPKNRAWFNAHAWRAVTRANSLQTWAGTVAARYAAEPTVAIYDLMNEPSDEAAAFTADLLLYVREMSAAIKAAAPNALVYTGVGFPSDVGGQVPWQQIFQGLDFCAVHDYEATGYLDKARWALLYARNLGKPLIVDEFGVTAKGRYGAWSDTDKDSNGLPAVSWEAQARLVHEFLSSAMAVPDVFAALLWSWMDTDTGGWYTGAGQYEPVRQARTHQVIHDVDPIGSRFAHDTVGNLSAWMAATHTLRYPPGTQIGGSATGASSLNFVYDRMQPEPYDVPIQAQAPFAAQTITPPGLDTIPSLRFSGSNLYEASDCHLGGTGYNAQSFIAVIYPTAVASGALHYLIAPTSGAAFCVRINGTTSKVEVAKLGSAAQASSTDPILLNQINVVEAAWNATAGAYQLRLNGRDQVSGTAAATTFAPDVALIGSLSGGRSGFIGHMIEFLVWARYNTEADWSRVRAYLRRKYRLAP